MINKKGVIKLDTKIWDVREYNEDLQQYPKINELKDIVLNGGLIGLPTETVYGLAANATDEEAVAKIYEAKGRPSDNPLIVHIHSKDQLKGFTYTLDARVEKLMQAFWPGPISFILPLKPGYLCRKVSGGLSSVAVRMPSHSVGRQLLQIINEPLAAPSANLSGRPSPTTFNHVYQDLNGRIDGIVQAEQSEEGLESTVLDCTSFPYKIARPGSITAAMITDILPNSITHADYNDTEQPIAPGMKYKHYSPNTPLTIITDIESKIGNDGKDWSSIAFIVPSNKVTFIPSEAQFIQLCQDDNDVKQASHNLYDVLHSLDENENISAAYIYGFELNDNTEAIMNRMLKAAGNHIIKGCEL